MRLRSWLGGGLAVAATSVAPAAMNREAIFMIIAHLRLPHVEPAPVAFWRMVGTESQVDDIVEPKFFG